jgi:Reverse transcriptase (RNA-dependent DNA polymerase)/GAG-pre-integrase domain
MVIFQIIPSLFGVQPNFFNDVLGYLLLSIIVVNKYTYYMNNDYRPSSRNRAYIPKSQRSYLSRFVKTRCYKETVDTLGRIVGALIMPLEQWVKQFKVTRRKRVLRRANKRIANTSRGSTKYRAIRYLLLASAVQGTIHKAHTAAAANDELNEGLSKRSTEYATWDTDSYEVKVDSGCSVSISGEIRDFIPGSLKVSSGKMTVQGYGSSLSSVTHTGTILWKVLDDDNVIREIKIPQSLYIPGDSTRLLSPQHLAQVTDSTNVPVKQRTTSTTYSDCMILQWSQKMHKCTIPLDRYNLGTLHTVPGYKRYKAFCTQTQKQFASNDEIKRKCFSIDMDSKQQDDYFTHTITQNEGVIVDDEDDDVTIKHSNTLSNNQSIRNKGIMESFQHEDFHDVKEDTDQMNADYRDVQRDEDLMMLLHQKLGHISFQRIIRMAKAGLLPKRLAKCNAPLCQACMFGKLTRKPTRYKGIENKRPIRKASKPGEVVSVDQLESPIDGFVAQIKGRLFRQHRYRCATIFVDHFSDLSYVHLQSSTNAAETLEAKRTFELFAQSHGVVVQQYHADNGRFAEHAWIEDVRRKAQILTFSGVGAHHQNGRAEKRIRDLQDMARTSLLHAQRMWPDAINVHLWPYALRHANEAINMTPFKDSVCTPLEKFSESKIRPNYRNIHTFGCPAYVLDGAIQNGRKGGKWTSRARLAIYLGASPNHARSVGLVLSLATGLVSPQYHIKCDDTFETLKHTNVPKSLWQSLSGLVNSSSSTSEKQVTASSTSNEIPVSTHLNINNHLGADNKERTRKNPGETLNEEDDADLYEYIQDSESTLYDEEAQDEKSENESESETQSITQELPTIENDPRLVTTTRSGRQVRLPTRYNDYVELPLISENTLYQYQFDTCPHALYSSMEYAKDDKQDTMYLHQAMKAPDKLKFIEAMNKEINAHESNKNWALIKKDKVPPGKSILPAIWAMRRKRDIATQKVYKWKARLNIHGGKQVKGIDYWETYAPVASWPSIRLVMLLATLHGWATHQLDFVMTFPQAPVETDMYMQYLPDTELKGLTHPIIV